MMSGQGSSSCSSRGKSVIEDAGRGSTTCPYCNSNQSSNISHGLWAETLTLDDYQDLLDRGWERSGCYLFKPEMEITCCPPYIIRLRAKDFIRSKEQLRVSKRMQRWVPFDIAKPLLDKKKYVVLSDYANAQNVGSSLVEEAREPSDMRPDDIDDVDSSGASAAKDAMKLDSDFKLSECNPYEEISDLDSVPVDIGNILIGLDEGHVRYKDLPVDLAPDFRIHVENQLMRYLKVVGSQLSERMVYSVT